MRNAKRDFLCFVCSEGFDTHEQMKDHIFANHREGDDYVICTRCLTPLRDLCNHYKTKHIGIQIPANAQTKPIIIRDCYKNKKTRLEDPYEDNSRR